MLILLSACSGVKDISKLKEKDILFSLQKGSCFGYCPVYIFSVYKNGLATYRGSAHTEKLGLYSKLYSEEEINMAINEFKRIDFFSLNDEYPYDVIDHPQSIVFYRENKKTKSVTSRDGKPQALKDLQVILEKMANSPGWKLEKAAEVTAVENTQDRQPVQEIIIESEIIIEPKPYVSLPKWIQKYEAYGVRMVRKIAPELNLWLITFDSGKIRPSELMESIKNDPDIGNAEFNKHISTRDR